MLTLPSITSCWSQSAGVWMCLIRPAPRRLAIAMPAVASTRILKACFTWTPRSASMWTNPMPIDAAFTAA